MENQKIKYRYRVTVPPVPFNSEGFTPVSCDISAVDWESLTWGRFGSGGNFACRHMFVDDWRLEHLWRRLQLGLLKVCTCDVVTAPDFSIETNFPLPLAAYQVWRSAALAQYWISYGVQVVPVLQWCSRDTFPVCKKGIQPGSVVAVRGPQKGTEADWRIGAEYMQHFLQPALVLHFGRRVKGVWDNVIFRPLRGKAHASVT